MALFFGLGDMLGTWLFGSDTTLSSALAKLGYMRYLYPSINFHEASLITSSTTKLSAP
jgi:hypothetical protein